MQCAYCHNEIQGVSFVEENGLQFCNPLHRYSYRQANGHSAASAMPMPPELRAQGMNGTADPKQKSSTLIGSIIGSGIGLAASTYLGATLLVPLVLFTVILLLLKKFASLSDANRIAFAILGAHFLWMALGAAITGAWMTVGIDLLVIFIGLAWLAMRYSLGPVVLLLAYQVISLVVNIMVLINAETGSEQFKGLIVSIMLRLSSSLLLAIGYVRFRKESKPESLGSLPSQPAV